MARVLILREARAASRTASDLALRGHAAIVLPLEAAISLDDPPPAAPFDGFVVTSARAVPALSAKFAGDDRPCFAVGSTTAAALGRARFPDVRCGGGTAETLPSLLRERFGRRGGDVRLLYPAGRNRTGALEAALAGTRFLLAPWEVYDIVSLEPGEAELRAVSAGDAIDAVLLLSAGQAEAYGARLAPLFRAAGRSPRLLCLSQRIVAHLPAGIADRAEISEAPDLASLFERL